MFEILGTAMAVFLLLAVAMPDRFLPECLFKTKAKKLGANHWGVYEGCETDVPESLKSIEAPKPGRKERIVAGSAMYAQGRGVSMKR